MSGKKQFEPRKVADRPEVKRRVCELAVAAGIWSDPDDKPARLFRKLDDAERAAKKSKLDLLLPPIEDIFRVTHRQDRTTGAARLAGTIVEALCTASKGDELRVREALKAIGWLRTRLRFLVASYDPENAWDAVIIELANIWFGD
jgi:hypothetical protein